jgi:hypothetical protein
MDGVPGLATGKLKLMDWPSVTGWVAQGGAYLGTKRAPPKDEQLPQIAQKLKEYGIQALLIIGGFEVISLFVICTNRTILRARIRETLYFTITLAIWPKKRQAFVFTLYFADTSAFLIYFHPVIDCFHATLLMDKIDDNNKTVTLLLLIRIF